MSTYNVEIKEVLCKVVAVDVSNREQAEEIISDQWNDGVHVLDSDDFKSVSFTAKQPEKNRKYER